MGAGIRGERRLDRLPLTIIGGNLNDITYTLPIPSAQVKSSILLAGLFSPGPVTVIEPVPCRDHTEIMFKYFGLPVKKTGKKIFLGEIKPFHARPIAVPGDISSAAFFIAAGLILKGSSIVIENAGLNPLRMGLVNILKHIGAKIRIIKYKSRGLPEPAGDIIIDAQPLLKPFHLKARDIPGLIDEIPVLCVLATQLKGTSSIRGAGELRVKETDRIKAIAWNLRRLGADIKELRCGLVIKGGVPLRGAEVKSFGDHRMAMSMAIAGLLSRGRTKVLDSACINISFPNFIPLLKTISFNMR
jgi:3-phosphoshikimate 1-carboxyvinyltransferase